jgi:hypothetical protein
MFIKNMLALEGLQRFFFFFLALAASWVVEGWVDARATW